MEPAVKVLRLRSYAKVNLGLEVLGQRQDGYHELRTLFQTIAPAAGLSIQVTRERLDNPPFGPWVGLGITAAWAVAALVIGART